MTKAALLYREITKPLFRGTVIKEVKNECVFCKLIHHWRKILLLKKKKILLASKYRLVGGFWLHCTTIADKQCEILVNAMKEFASTV
jgi:hypothetical protein